MSPVGAGTTRLAEPSAADRERVEEIVRATGMFREEEVAIALEVFSGAVTAPGQDYLAQGAYDDNDRLVAFTCYGPTPGTLGTWDLYWIAADPAVHRSGIGRRLLRATEDAIRARGGRLVVVETASRPDYAPTRAFYEALGYTPQTRIPDYYAPRDDLVIYVKRLDPVTMESPHHG